MHFRYSLKIKATILNEGWASDPLSKVVLNQILNNLCSHAADQNILQVYHQHQHHHQHHQHHLDQCRTWEEAFCRWYQELTSQTFKNSDVRSILTKNRLYKSNASRHCFLFISKYFSARNWEIRNCRAELCTGCVMSEHRTRWQTNFYTPDDEYILTAKLQSRHETPQNNDSNNKTDTYLYTVWQDHR